METIAFDTVSDALEEKPPKLTVIVAVPLERPVAEPATTVATLGTLEVQAAEAVTSETVPSEYVAVALNATVPPTEVFATLGEMESETSFAGVTVSVVAPPTAPTLAVIIVDPAEIAVATLPLVVATIGALEVQVAAAVTSPVLPSE
jgi:hypothetical protein